MKKGFTLIELLAVIIILAILMIIAVPNILSTLSTARSSSFITQAESIYKTAEQQYIIDSMTGTGSTCYDRSNLNLDSISSSVSFSVIMNSVNGTVQSITVTDSGQQFTATGTSMNNIAITEYDSTELECGNLATYTINVSVTGGTSSAASKEVTSGGSETFTITASSGYDITTATVSGTGCSLSSNKQTLSASGVTSNVTCTVTLLQSDLGPTLIAATSGQTHKGVVYLNPINLTRTCIQENTQIGFGAANPSGCMKFYVFDDSGTSYKMILDHNSTATVAWNSSNSNSQMNQVATALSNDTSDWNGSPRLITADEVAQIVGASNATDNSTKPGVSWLSTKTYKENTGDNLVTDVSTQISWFYLDGSGTTYSTSNGWQKQNLTNSKSAYGWLYDYTNGCSSSGCDNSTNGVNPNNGYWTSTKKSGTNSKVYTVRNIGALKEAYANIADEYGLRPVIEIAKSNFSQ